MRPTTFDLPETAVSLNLGQCCWRTVATTPTGSESLHEEGRVGQHPAEKQSQRSDLLSPCPLPCSQVERFFNRIKQCRRVATRCDRLAANYLAFVQLASIRRLNESASAERMKNLVENRFVTRTPDPKSRSGTIYLPTEKTLALKPMVEAIIEWSLTYGPSGKKESKNTAPMKKASSASRKRYHRPKIDLVKKMIPPRAPRFQE